MDVPILKQGPYLIATVQSALSDADLVKLREAIVADVGRHRSRGVILDVTALDVLDSFATDTLSEMAHMTRLRGARTVVVGISPDVAYAMAHMGLTLDGIYAALDLEEGLEYLDRALPNGPRP
jgi:rsbT antagonist protein RsbS